VISCVASGVQPSTVRARGNCAFEREARSCDRLDLMPRLPENLRMLTFFDAEPTDLSHPKLISLGFVAFDASEDFLPYQNGLLGHDSRGGTSVELPGPPPNGDCDEGAG
jgi:hypothetical protein